MTENKTDEQILAEEKKRKDSNGSLLETTFGSSVTGEALNTPGFEIEYAPHKSQGLQNASDMWIDKARLYGGISKEKMGLGSIKGLSRK